jgi:Fervidolysin N-terminal prodomain
MRLRHIPPLILVLLVPVTSLAIATTSCDRTVVPSAPMRAGEGAPSQTYRSGELLVKFKTGVTRERIDEINRALGVESITYDQRLSRLHAKIPDNRSVEEMVKRYSELPDVEYAEPNYLRKSMGHMGEGAASR